jgi:hypothetical protein
VQKTRKKLNDDKISVVQKNKKKNWTVTKFMFFILNISGINDYKGIYFNAQIFN